jgi:hypothetical protein
MAAGIHKASLPMIAGVVLVGCTGIPLARLQPTSSAVPATCPTIDNLVPIVGGVLAPPGAPPQTLGFVVPGGVPVGSPAPSAAPGGAIPAVQKVRNFSDLVATGKARLANLPQEVQGDDVTDAIFRVIIKTSAQAQINRAKIGASAPGTAPAGLDEQQAAVNDFAVPTNITQRQLRTFADKLVDKGLQPNIIAAAAPGAPDASQPPTQKPNALAAYFTAYYKGDFYDRFSQSVSKPSLSTTIPDTEIAAALTVLIEYIADLVDPTPVLGNTDMPVATPTQAPGAAGGAASATTFYPGESSKEPTALSAGLATYKNIANNKCGVTIDNAKVLSAIANAAGDRAAAISGLVSQSWGGLSIGFGVLGKFSIGDNQTLGTVVKTAATRLGTRISYAASYYALDKLGSAPSGAPPPAGVAPRRIESPA